MPGGEPQPRVLTPPIPEHMLPLAQEAWRRAVQEMEYVPGWLTATDWRVLETWAVDYAIWRDCLAAIKEFGLTFMDSFTDSSGQEHLKPKARPELKTLNETANRMLRSESALGFAPAFRARISLDRHDEPEDDILEG